MSRKKLNTKQRLKQADRLKKWVVNSPILNMLRRARSRARRDGIQYSVTNKPVMPTHCPILGITLRRSTVKANDASPSLDRVNPSLGYVDGNLQIISNKANVMKNNASPEDLKKFAAWIRVTYGD